MRRVGLSALIFLALLAMPDVMFGADKATLAPRAEETAYHENIVPLLKQYCFKCHGSEKQCADLNLSKYADAAAVASDRETWETVLDYVDSGQMPPPKEPRPKPEEVTRLVQWIEANLSTFDCKGPLDPGRVTIRRLNRAEYNNTIRDLVGVDFQPADDFPTDDVGYGFDNIGDVLTLSPILLEKYLTAAEQVAQRAIVVDRTDFGEQKTWEGRDLRNAGGSNFGNAGRVLASNGEVAVSHKVSKDGEYVFRVRAFAQQAGQEPAKMALKKDGETIQELEVKAVEGDPETYEVRTNLKAGDHRFAAAFTNDYYNPDEPNSNRRDRNLYIQKLEVQGPVVPGGRELPESHKRIIFREPKNENDVEACAREILDRFASRAYRRPARKDEVDRLVHFVNLALKNDQNFEQGVRLAVTAVLVSPHFLFRVELDQGGKDQSAGPQPLDDYELASRMSYFLWSSMPDEELFRLAAEGKLKDPKVLEAQARRMLKDPKAWALVENFAGQWLQIRNLDTVTPATNVFKDFDAELRNAMRGETQRFFEAIMREDRSILEFLNADFTFVNERLAKLYGIEGVQGDDFQRVTLDGDRRGGVLTQASILTITSNPTRTSPVKRGKWILEQILGTPPPPPPPDVPELKEDRRSVREASLRVRLEQHRADPGCASCHSRMDPLGFSLENYDAIGAWRDQDGKFPIDATGSLPTGESFNGSMELKALLLSKKDQFARCLTEKMLTYALGRGLEATDTCEVDQTLQALAANDYKFSTLVGEIVKSVPFRMRKGQGGE